MHPFRIWTMASGAKIPIHKMDDGHLQNAVRYLTKQYRRQSAILAGYSMQAVGEMAQDAIDQGLHELEAMSDDQYIAYRVPQYIYMLEQLDLRGLRVMTDAEMECLKELNQMIRESIDNGQE